MASKGRVRVEPGRKRVRAVVDGVPIADTTRPVLVWEVPYYPAYYLPRADVHTDLLEPNGETKRSPSRGDAIGHALRVGDRVVKQAAWTFPDSPIEELRELVRFEWDAIDHWFEEDEEVFTHPRDPYRRVDILASSRHVQVVVEGVTLADSHQPRILFETGLPPRYYLPLTDVRLDLLRPSTTESHCPYKGTATYWSAQVGSELGQDLVWTYRSPFPESQKIMGLACFFNERVDLYVDGELQARPHTPFS